MFPPNQSQKSLNWGGRFLEGPKLVRVINVTFISRLPPISPAKYFYNTANPRQSLHDAPPLPPRASTSAFMKRSFSSTSQNDESVDAANKEEEAGAAKVIENSFHIKGRGRKTTSVGTHKPPPGFKKEEDEKVSKPGGKGKGKAVKPPVEVIELDSSGDEDHVGDLEMTPPRGKKQKVEVEVKGKGTAKQKESDDEIEPFSDEEKARDLSSDPLAMSFSRDIPRGTVAKRREAYEPARPVVSNMRRRVRHIISCFSLM